MVPAFAVHEHSLLSFKPQENSGLHASYAYVCGVVFGHQSPKDVISPTIC